MTSTGDKRRALAAASPPKPPPTITTRGRCSFIFSPSSSIWTCKFCPRAKPKSRSDLVARLASFPKLARVSCAVANVLTFSPADLIRRPTDSRTDKSLKWWHLARWCKTLRRFHRDSLQPLNYKVNGLGVAHNRRTIALQAGSLLLYVRAKNEKGSVATN